MGDLFRSALSWVGGSGAAAGGGGAQSELIGQSVEVGGLKLRVREKIAEGGFAMVFAATDAQGQEYALKRLLAADKEAAEGILKEIRFLRVLTGHPHIIRYVQACSLSPQESGHGRAEYLVLTELCTGGPVVDAIHRAKLSPSHVLRIFAATARAVLHMHSQSPLAIVHRDLKAENLLLDSRGLVKLCDFGSSTTETFQPGPDWSAHQRSVVEEEAAKNTTPMYRAPELLDLWLDYPIGASLDVWAMGCMLYYLAYRVHPFEDSAKLRITNGNYSLPPNPGPFEPFNAIIQGCLRVDPRERPSVRELVESVEALAVVLGVNLDEPLKDLMPPGTLRTPKPSRPAKPAPPASTAAPSRPPPPARPAPPKAQPAAGRPPPPRPPPAHPASQPQHPSDPGQAGEAETGSGLLGSMMRGGGSLFKNLKDTSAKIGSAVSTSVGAKGVDFTYVTSRLALAPMEAGVPEMVLSGVEDHLRTLLEARHKDKFAVYNLAQRKMKWNFDGQLSEVPLGGPALRPPSLHSVFLIARNVVLWLRQHPSNIAVLAGPESYAVLLAACVLVHTRLVATPKEALELLAARRSRPVLSASFRRYLDYVERLSRPEPDSRPSLHNRPVQLVALRASPLPLFNRAKTGCRPFVEVTVNGEKVLSTSQEYEKLPPYELSETRELEQVLGVGVVGDVSVALFHARSTLGAKVQGRFAGLPICRLSFHTSLVPRDAHLLEFRLDDLDDLDDDRSKYAGDAFTLSLALEMGGTDQAFEDDKPPAFWALETKGLGPKLLTSDAEEREQIARSLGIRSAAQASPDQPRKAQEAKAKDPPTGNFFHSLDWNADQHSGPSAGGSRDGSRDGSRSPAVAPAEAAKVDAALEAERAAGIRVGTGTPSPSEDEPVPAEPEPDVGDLLNLGGAPPVPKPSAPAAAPSSNPFDPFAQFAAEPAAPAQKADGLEDLFAGLSSAEAKAPSPQPASGEPDLLQGWSAANVMAGAGQPSALPRNLSNPGSVGAAPKPAAPADPFAGLGLGGGPPPMAAQNSWKPPTPTAPLSRSGTPLGSGTPSMQRPNYNVPSSAFTAGAEPAPGTAGAKPKVSGMEFDDILSQSGFSKTPGSSGPQTIADMVRKEEEKVTDPDVLRIRDWTRGKERNIRALLGTLHEVVWDGCKWSQVSMGDCLTPVQIKKVYRKACLAVHPDKLQGSPHEAFAKLVFTELNDAYTEYQNAGEPSF